MEQFRAVLDAEERWLSAAVHSGDFARWRSRVIREVMDDRSPYAQALRRGHGADRQDEFIQSWQALIAAALERTAAGCGTGAGPATASVVPGRLEKVAIAILAALHGGAALSWLAQDARSLEAALDIALAPVLLHPEREGRDDRRPA